METGHPHGTTRRGALAALAGAALVGAPFINRGRFALFAQSTREYPERAIRLVRDSLVIDMLNQFLYRRDLQPKLRQWLSQPGAFTAADFQRFLDSGINAINFGNGAESYEEGIRLFAEWNGFIAQYPDWLLRIGSASDFERAKSSRHYGNCISRWRFGTAPRAGFPKLPVPEARGTPIWWARPVTARVQSQTGSSSLRLPALVTNSVSSRIVAFSFMRWKSRGPHKPRTPVRYS
jgi:hypothetical protein